MRTLILWFLPFLCFATPEYVYVNEYCTGETEVRIPFGRVDCVTDTYAIEFERGKNWKDGIGQSLYYAMITGKQPMIYLIDDGQYTEVLKNTIKHYNLDIGVRVIPPR